MVVDITLTPRAHTAKTDLYLSGNMCFHDYDNTHRQGHEAEVLISREVEVMS